MKKDIDSYIFDNPIMKNKNINIIIGVIVGVISLAILNGNLILSLNNLIIRSLCLVFIIICAKRNIILAIILSVLYIILHLNNSVNENFANADDSDEDENNDDKEDSYNEDDDLDEDQKKQKEKEKEDEEEKNKKQVLESSDDNTCLIKCLQKKYSLKDCSTICDEICDCSNSNDDNDNNDNNDNDDNNDDDNDSDKDESDEDVNYRNNLDKLKDMMRKTTKDIV